MWIVDLEEMNCCWASGRVPNIDLGKIESHCGKTREELEDEADRAPFICFRLNLCVKIFIYLYSFKYFNIYAHFSF